MRSDLEKPSHAESARKTLGISGRRTNSRGWLGNSCVYPRHSMGLPYIAYIGVVLVVNVGIYGGPISRVWVWCFFGSGKGSPPDFHSNLHRPDHSFDAWALLRNRPWEFSQNETTLRVPLSSLGCFVLFPWAISRAKRIMSKDNRS